ncbi:hypothetical protein EHI8A_099060, partial [Entamoeba histolytica HM-1:IMSS-B]
MLVLGKDHSLFFEAYNDASDIDGDGVLDLKFKPTIAYYGLFDSALCYSHSGGSGNGDKFTPIGKATSNSAGTYATCSGSWSGNWLNYVTTSRIDALRKVLYGGYRQLDDTSQTVLRRAYIPQDGHSWAKEYTSVAVDGYDIANFTPLSAPANGTRLFFGNVTMTAGTNCSVLSSCSNLPPLLSVVKTADTTTRVWDWASSESPVLNNNTYGRGTRTNYTVQVAVCTTDYHDNDCQAYPNGQYKPVGLLHDFGADDAMLFGLLTGSYNKNMSGGVLRKVVSRFSTEVNANTGVFSANATIVRALDALRIRDYNNGGNGSAYRRGSYRTGIMPEGNYPDWGNPIAEMMYETLRYFAGKAAATAAFTGNNSDTGQNEDANVGLPQPAWDNPYASNSAANAHCASGDQKTNTYVVALASSLPKFEFNVGGKTVSLVPFAKTINGVGTNRSRGSYQPTDAIVDLYVESYSSTGAVFRVNYEADEQGNDFDSDVIVKYDISVASGQLKVVVTPTAQSTGSNQNLGYVISGTNRDGAYLNNNSVAAPAVLPSLSTSSGTTTNYDTYATGLNVTYWSGELTKTTVAIGTANGATNKTTTTAWKASTMMPAWTDRTILIPAVPGTGTGLRSFTYKNLADRTYDGKPLQTNLDADKVDFLKGDASKESSLYRKRSAANALEGATGDYATFKANQARVAPMVYVGANDGMLHGFNANTGKETFAFIPTAVIPNLYQLARSTYNDASASLHTYYVDGSPVIADVFFGQQWRKVLIGTLRGGGREVFALDITDPTSPKLLWEFTGADIRTNPANGSAQGVTNSRSDSTLGNSFGTPLV